MGVWDNIVSAWKGTQEMPDGPGNKYNFDCMVELVKDPPKNLIIIDAREPVEHETATIPGCVNVPFRSCPEAFSLPADEFEAKFGFSKPEHDVELVFFCGSGGRASKLQQKAIESGYTNTSLYPGSMNDWIANGGDKLKL